MTITYHAGRRIQGTSSDRTSLSYTQDYSNVISTYSPTFFLKIDEGTGTSLANTGSNTGYTASLDVSNGNPAWVDGVTGYAVSIDGSSGYTAPKISTSDLPTNQNQNYSFTMTMKLTGTLPTSGKTWFWVWGNGDLGQYNIGVDWASGSVYYGYYNNGWYYITGTSGDITDGEWHTIGITHSSGQAVKLYIDGSQVGSGTGNDTWGFTEQANTIKSSTSGVTLIVDSVFFKNTVLTDSDMQGIHNNLLTGNLILGNNVQSGSRFEATDTRKIYYGALPSITDSTLNSTDGTTGWDMTNAGSSISLDTSNNEVDFLAPTGAKSCYYDLGANISESWVLRFKMTWSGAGSNQPIYWIGVSNSQTIVSNSTSIKGAFIMFYGSSVYKMVTSNSQRIDQSGSNNLSPSTTCDATPYWVEIIKNGSTDITVSIYPNSSYGTATATYTNTINLSGLRYMNGITYIQGSGTTGTFSDVKFYNGVTNTTDFIWTEES